MKKVIFKKVEIIDFQKLRNFTHEFIDGTTLFKAANGVGKTTILHALTWVISGTNLLDQSDKHFNVLPTDQSGNLIEDTEPSVILTLEIDGEEVILQRKYITKGKNSTRKYFINGTSLKKGEFNAKLLALFGIDDNNHYKLLTNINHFTTNLSENDQREIIMSMIPVIGYESICELDERFLDLKELSDAKFEKVYATTITKRNEGKEAVKTVKNRASENATALDKYVLDSEMDYEKAELNLETSTKKIDNMEEEIDNKGSYFEKLSDLQLDKKDVELEIENFEKNFRKNKQSKIDEKGYEIRRISNTKEDLETKVTDQRSDWSRLNVSKENSEVEVQEELSADLKRLDEDHKSNVEYVNRRFDKEIQELEDKLSNLKEVAIIANCDVCGQDLPDDQVSRSEENKDRRLGVILKEIDAKKKEKSKERELNKQEIVYKKVKLSEDLKAKIDKRVKSYKSQMDKIVVDADSNKTKISNIDKEIELLTSDIEKLEKKEIDQKEKDDLYAKKQRIQTKIDNLSQGESTFTSEDLRIERVHKESLERQLSEYKLYKQDLGRKKEIAAEKKLKTKALANLNAKVELLGEYLRIKNTMLSKELEKYFSGDVTFKLLDFIADGTPKNVFKILVQGINFATNVNPGAKIRAGIEFVNFFQKYYDVYMPIMVDEKTSMSGKLPCVAAQVMACEVTEDPKLVIEEIEREEQE